MTMIGKTNLMQSFHVNSKWISRAWILYATLLLYPLLRFKPLTELLGSFLSEIKNSSRDVSKLDTHINKYLSIYMYICMKHHHNNSDEMKWYFMTINESFWQWNLIFHAESYAWSSLQVIFDSWKCRKTFAYVLWWISFIIWKY